MKTLHQYIALAVAMTLAGCAAEDRQTSSTDTTGHPELTGIRAEIVGGGDTKATRAGTVTPLVDYVGRDAFIPYDRTVFTNIRRTQNALTEFTYPGAGTYDGIIFKAGAELGWQRVADGGPERVFWTDAVSAHTFVAYSIPQAPNFEWNKYQFTQGATRKTYYLGSIGDPTDPDDIVYDDADDLDAEDLLIAYDTNMQAETGGSVALVKFYHALSSVRVVVNISGFSSTTSDHKAVVSNMQLLHQPTMYVWMQSDWGAQPLRASREGQSFTDQQMVDAAWGSTAPAFDQRKNLTLWTPVPAGSGSGQSKTFTFYGITTPQPSDYIGTLAEGSDLRKAELAFDVTYPNPLKPSQTITKSYKASLADDVCFEAGFNTTINISLNHKNEQLTVGAEYENWIFQDTPDVGELKKNSTFLQSVGHDGENVTILGDDNATIDDATWLYEFDGTVYDIYGHDGSSETEAYQISTAYQLLSFAYEVQNGNSFQGKYVRLDADITLQKSADKTAEELEEGGSAALVWPGIGTADNAFEGTFLGGNRFVYRLYGSPLFANIGSHAKIERLQVQALTPFSSATVPVTGSGLFAATNAGHIWASRVVGDVSLSADNAGAFVGTNTGSLYCCYHIGATKGSGAVGGLVGTNSGTVSCCYQAGAVTGSGTVGGVVATNSGTLYGNYYNETLCPASVTIEGVTGETTTGMTKQAFVTTLNNAVAAWRAANTGYTAYTAYTFVYQPANYPKLAE